MQNRRIPVPPVVCVVVPWKQFQEKRIMPFFARLLVVPLERVVLHFTVPTAGQHWRDIMACRSCGIRGASL